MTTIKDPVKFVEEFWPQIELNVAQKKMLTEIWDAKEIIPWPPGVPVSDSYRLIHHLLNSVIAYQVKDKT